MKSETLGPNGEATIYLGDCLEILPTLTGVDAVVTDPPYGIGAARMTLGNGKKKFDRGGGAWDDLRPDIKPIIAAAPIAIVWGGNYFSDVLPPTNDWLVWDKAQPDSVSFSGAEFAWSNVGRNARVKRHHWSREEKEHPTMKPIAVMEWCLSFVLNANTILDPFMGSGTTGVACANLGRLFIGIEIEPKYYDIARKRISDAYAQARLFDEPPAPHPTQGDLI